jgi:hypothetical protein
MKYRQTNALLLVIVAVVLAIGSTADSNLAHAQSEGESESEKGQEIEQRNVCSGWAVCTNEAVNTEDSGLPTTETLIATPN